MRRGAVNSTAKELGCNKVALALDAIERCKNEWGSVKIQEAQSLLLTLDNAVEG